MTKKDRDAKIVDIANDLQVLRQKRAEVDECVFKLEQKISQLMPVNKKGK